jgi:hypothetical protein
VGMLTIFHDLMEPARWYLQHYTKAAQQVAPLDVMAPADATRPEEKEQTG